MSAGCREPGASACADQAVALNGRSLSWQRCGQPGAHRLERHGMSPCASATARYATLDSRVTTAVSGLLQRGDAPPTPAAWAPFQCEQAGPSATGRRASVMAASSRPGITGRFPFHSALYWLHWQERNREIRNSEYGFSDFKLAHNSAHKLVLAEFAAAGGNKSDLSSQYPCVYRADLAYSALECMASRAESAEDAVRAARIRKGLEDIDRFTSSKVLKLASEYGIAVPSPLDDPQLLRWQSASADLYAIARSEQRRTNRHLHGDVTAALTRIGRITRTAYLAYNETADDLPERGYTEFKVQLYYDGLRRLAEEANRKGDSLRCLSIRRRMFELGEAVHAELRWLQVTHGISDTEAARATLGKKMGVFPGAVALTVAQPGLLKCAAGLPDNQSVVSDCMAGISFEQNPAAGATALGRFHGLSARPEMAGQDTSSLSDLEI